MPSEYIVGNKPHSLLLCKPCSAQSQVANNCFFFFFFKWEYLWLQFALAGEIQIIFLLCE